MKQAKLGKYSKR